MSRRLERWRGRLERELPEVVVCRGGDCGSRRKHPRTDSPGQLARLREELPADAATLTVSRCLDACEHSNVVVVLPGRTARDAGVGPTWIGEVLDDATTSAVIGWVTAGGARTEPPGPVALRRFSASPSSEHDLAARRSSRRVR